VARKTVKFNVNPLLGGPSLHERAGTGSPYRELALSSIAVDPAQPRKVFNEEGLNELASSIKEHGLINPIRVKALKNGTYQVIAGERRFRAAKLAQLETIAAVVESQDATAGEVLAKQLVENLQRQDLSPMERAIAVGQLRDEFQWSIREISTRLGISKGAVQRSLEVLALPDDLQAALVAGASESKVLLLGQIKDKTLRKEFLNQIEYLSRAQLEEELKLLKRQLKERESNAETYHGGTSVKEARPASIEDTRIVEEIQKTLGTRVMLSRKDGKDGQGKLSIEFYSSSDLYEIYRRLTA